jgi:hypothetical protein
MTLLKPVGKPQSIVRVMQQNSFGRFFNFFMKFLFWSPSLNKTWWWWWCFEWKSLKRVCPQLGSLVGPVALLILSAVVMHSPPSPTHRNVHPDATASNGNFMHDIQSALSQLYTLHHATDAPDGTSDSGCTHAECALKHKHLSRQLHTREEELRLAAGTSFFSLSCAHVCA